MTTYTVTPLGWQYAVRRHGVLVRVYDTREEAETSARVRNRQPELEA